MNAWKGLSGDCARFLPAGWVQLVVVIAACLVGGCVSKSTAQARARAAFLAGQQQEASVLAHQQAQFHGPTVTVMGEVRNSLIPWTADLTLGKAVIAANYFGKTDPAVIVIQRDGKEIPYDPKTLLNGQDVALQPYDVILLK